jgi:hypothetical protein
MKTYDPNKESSYISYTDMNNLYSVGMVQKLPYKEFKFIDVDTFDNNRIYSDDDIGYIIECDLEYPIELHDKHNAIPLCPELLEIHESMLSDYNKKILES